MKQYPFFDMKALTGRYADELERACSEVIRSGWFLHGPQTEALERELAQFCNVEHCVAVSNGLDALRLIMKAWVEMGRLHPGDEVLVAANTYIASVLAISDAGLKPVLVEPEEDTMNISAERARQAIGPKTKVLMEVHLYGTPARHSRLRKLAQEHGLLIIEDNAQSIGAMEDGVRTGGMGDAAGFSFYPTKNVGALGDAGAVTTNDAELAQCVRALANYGSDRRYHNIYQGYNCRMDEIQAAMLRVKLHHITEETLRRQAVARAYTENIHHEDITLPQHIEGMEQVWHQYIIRCSRRDELKEYLAQNGVQTDIHYATPPHLQPCMAGEFHGVYPLTECLASEVLSLPIATTTPEEAREIAEVIGGFGKEGLGELRAESLELRERLRGDYL